MDEGRGISKNKNGVERVSKKSHKVRMRKIIDWG